MTTAFLFDLDGTLCDSRPGLVVSLRAAFEALDIETDADLTGFLGAPLPAIFRAASPGIDDIDIAYGVRKFRAAYEAYGIAHSPLYPGVEAMLAALKAAGRAVWLATSKPQIYAERILVSTGIAGFFDGVVGAGLAETDTKSLLIGRALQGAGVAGETAMMLGDRAYDVVGALDNGVLPVGALWGYGAREELETAGCLHFAENVADFSAHYGGSGVATGPRGPL